MFEFRRLYCAHAKLHAPFPFDGLLVTIRESMSCGLHNSVKLGVCSPE